MIAQGHALWPMSGKFVQNEAWWGMMCEGHGQVRMVTDGYVWVGMGALVCANTKTRQEGQKRIGQDGHRQRHAGQAEIDAGTGACTADIEANGGEQG